MVGKLNEKVGKPKELWKSLKSLGLPSKKASPSTICQKMEHYQGGHSSWKSWKCPGDLFCPDNVLEGDPFSAKGPGKVIELSNLRFEIVYKAWNVKGG